MKRAVLNNNAKRVELDGIKFRSEYEAEVYQYLESVGLHFEYEPFKYNLVPEFELDNITLTQPEFDSKGHKKGFGVTNKKMRAWSYTPDFVMCDTENNTTYIIECKGQITPDFEHKWKMFLYRLSKDKRNHYEVFLIQRKGEMKKIVDYILTKLNKGND